jgi:DNA-binding GntR family transcriptional regulator
MDTVTIVARENRLPYMRVVDGLREQIRSGELRPGDQIPTVTELCATYGVSKVTTLKALSTLRDEGLITTTPRWGSFVAES